MIRYKTRKNYKWVEVEIVSGDVKEIYDQDVVAVLPGSPERVKHDSEGTYTYPATAWVLIRILEAEVS